MIDRTVTLPLVWREVEDAMLCRLGSFDVGFVFLTGGAWGAECWWDDNKTMRDHPTRAAAMAALEEAVMALGVDRG